MLSSLSFPPTISQMSLSERERFSQHGKAAWTTDRILFEEFDKESYERQVEGLHHKPRYQFFRQCMAALKSNDIWFDAGCGHGSALIQYVQTYKKDAATVYGVTLSRPERKEEEDKMVEADQKYERLHIYLHDFLSFPTASLQGRVGVITDIYGSFYYCGRPSEVLKKFAAMLTVGGTLFLVFGVSSTVDVTLHAKAIDDKDLLARGSEGFFFLYLSTVRGFKVVAPEDVSPASIRNLFSSRANPDERADKGFWDRSWCLIRTDEPFDADPLYIRGEKIQLDDSLASSHSYRNYRWEISEKNKPYVEAMKEIRL